MLDLATIGIAFDTSGLEKGRRALDDTGKAADRTADSTEKLGKATDVLSRLYRDLGVAAAAYKVFQYVKDMAMLSARYEELGVVMTVVGRNAGYTAAQMAQYAKETQSMGISMIESRNTVIQLSQAQINLADASTLARVAQDAAVILVSANFSTELTTSVIWLNRHGIDVTCIRLKPYRMNGELLIDAAQIIPLPEAADYEIKVRAQAQEVKKVRTARQEIFRRFWTQYIDRARSRTTLYSNRSTTSDHWISAGVGRSGFSLNASLTEDRARLECYISMGKNSDERNKAAFRALQEKKGEIEKTFGGPLDWQELPDRIGCRICNDVAGGWKTTEVDWPDLQERMLNSITKLEAALKGPIQSL